MTQITFNDDRITGSRSRLRFPRSLLLLGALLLGAAALQVRSAVLIRPEREVEVQRIVPAAVSHWTIEDLPLGQTESLDEAAHELLGLDSFCYRRYTGGSERVFIFLAYWRGSNPLRDAGVRHFPDICWTLRGMNIVSGSSASVFRQSGRQLIDGAYREFAVEGSRTHVLYWHLTGGAPVEHWNRKGQSAGERVHGMWQGLTNGMLDRRRAERIFVRIHSALPPERMLEMEPVRQTVTNLAAAGIPLWQRND